ncbi:MAG: tetratricopeptide repeat protein [Nitrospirae bacterium]|nr:tetratricopeptide repeat protein [Candidatus Manganitrophaceae bacterium]
MKNIVVVVSMISLLVAGCSSTQKMLGGSSSPEAAAPKQLPETVKNEFSEGLKAYKSEQYVNAQQHFENVTRIDPSIPEAHLNLALTLYQQGKTTQADKELEQARNLYSREFGMGGRRGTTPSGSDQGMNRSTPPS